MHEHFYSLHAYSKICTLMQICVYIETNITWFDLQTQNLKENITCPDEWKQFKYRLTKFFYKI